MKVKHFFDLETCTLTYIVYDEISKDAIVIDPVLDFDYAGGFISTEQIENLSHFLKEQRLNLHFILETHVHADHLSGSALLKNHFPQAKTVICERICEVQKMSQTLFNLPTNFPMDGSQFDKRVADNEIFDAGSLKIKTLRTSGHTPCCLSYLVNDEAVFTGDALFMPDYGTGRCDFPGGDAKELYHSIQRLYALPDETKVFVGHDYMPGGRSLEFESSIGAEKRNNIHLTSKTSEAEFVLKRVSRDKTLSAPRLLFPSLQVNIRGGVLPEAEENGTCYLKIPVKKK